MVGVRRERKYCGAEWEVEKGMRGESGGDGMAKEL